MGREAFCSQNRFSMIFVHVFKCLEVRDVPRESRDFDEKADLFHLPHELTPFVVCLSISSGSTDAVDELTRTSSL